MIGRIAASAMAVLLAACGGRVADPLAACGAAVIAAEAFAIVQAGGTATTAEDRRRADLAMTLAMAACAGSAGADLDDPRWAALLARLEAAHVMLRDAR